MKTIHDLKNPVNAISNIVNDTEISISKMRNLTNNEIEDLQDMLDNLRIEFKTSQGMNIVEKFRQITFKEFVKGIKRTHKNLSKNGKNNFKVKVQLDFPEIIEIQSLSVKRIVNNLISNALKHT